MQPSNPYDFLNQNPGKPKLSLMPKGNSLKARLLVIGGGAVILLIILVIVINLLSGAGSKNAQTLTSIAQQQTEIMRIADSGLSKARSTAAKNLAVNSKLTTQTAQKDLLAFLQQNGHKVGEKELALGKDAATDKKLSDAEQTSRYDEVFLQVMQAELTEYAEALKKAYSEIDEPKVRILLDKDFKAAQLLIEQ